MILRKISLLVMLSTSGTSVFGIEWHRVTELTLELGKAEALKADGKKTKAERVVKETEQKLAELLAPGSVYEPGSKCRFYRKKKEMHSESFVNECIQNIRFVSAQSTIRYAKGDLTRGPIMETFEDLENNQHFQAKLKLVSGRIAGMFEYRPIQPFAFNCGYETPICQPTLTITVQILNISNIEKDSEKPKTQTPTSEEAR